MKEHGFLVGAEAGDEPATQETLNCVASSWRSAMYEPHDVQVVGLNLLSEGVAFDFYSAVIPVLDKMKMLSGNYWKVHTEADQHHLTMGLDLVEPVEPDSPKGRVYQRVLWHSASLYHQMLSSWVGEQVGALPQMRMM